MSRDRRPAVRAISVQDALTYAEKFQPGAMRRIRSMIPDDVLANIDATPKLGWVEVKDEVYVPTSIWSVLGDEDATEMILEFLESHFQITLLGSLIELTRKLFGLTPRSVLRVLPTGWRLIYRDFCDVTVSDTGERSAEVVLSRLSQTTIASNAHTSLFRAHFLGILRLTGLEGKVEILEIDRSAGRIRYALSWS